MPLATSMAEGSCVLEVSTDAAPCRDVSFYSQETQVASTSCAIGTQCALMSFISTSSQTEVASSVQDVDNIQAGALGKVVSSRDEADVAAKVGRHTCSCRLRFGNTGKKILLGGRLHSCLSCEQRNHHTTHGELWAIRTLYICTVCRKVFSKKCSLDIHMRLHTGKNSHVCRTCNKSFNCRSKLLIHERLHSGEKPHVCSTCKKRFASRSSLVRHEISHSGERAHVCSTCKKSFAHRYALVIHERSHTGERPYACSICQKCFITSSHLVAHGRLHSGERPYVCSICRKRFSQRSNMVAHERRFHSGNTT